MGMQNSAGIAGAMVVGRPGIVKGPKEIIRGPREVLTFSRIGLQKDGLNDGVLRCTASASYPKQQQRSSPPVAARAPAGGKRLSVNGDPALTASAGRQSVTESRSSIRKSRSVAEAIAAAAPPSSQLPLTFSPSKESSSSGGGGGGGEGEGRAAPAAAKGKAKAKAKSATHRGSLKPTIQQKGTAPEKVASSKEQDKAWDWLRTDRSQEGRTARKAVTALTHEAVTHRGYILEGQLVRLDHVDEMLAGTRIVSWPSDTSISPQCDSTKVTFQHDMTEAFLDLSKRVDRVCIVVAVSAWHCGGGFTSGGRHAMEEAACTQSTLFPSLEKVKKETKDKRYIPEHAVVLSPGVEWFRGPTTHGYPFVREARSVGAVVSVAMYNRNPKMSDCPVDAPSDEEEYLDGVRKKWQMTLTAAYQAGCTGIVIPPAGCGVYQNEPGTMGTLLGSLLAEQFRNCFSEVVVTGPKAFKEAVQDMVG